MANTLSFDDSQPTEVVESLSAEEQDSYRIGEQLQQEQQNLLAGKYKSAEELEQGYLELQKRMGEGQPNQQESFDVSDQLAKAYESYTSDKKFDASAFENVSKEDLIKAFFENSEEVPQAAEGTVDKATIDRQIASMGIAYSLGWSAMLALRWKLSRLSALPLGQEVGAVDSRVAR